MRLRVRGRIHPDRAPADLVVGVRVVEHRQPDAGDALIEIAAQLLERRRLVVHGETVAGPALDWLYIRRSCPVLQTLNKLLERLHRSVLARDRADGLVQDAAHAAFRSQLRKRQGILLTFMRVAMEVDCVLHAWYEGRVNHAGPIAAAGGIGGDAALADRGRVLSPLWHPFPSRSWRSGRYRRRSRRETARASRRSCRCRAREGALPRRAC